MNNEIDSKIEEFCECLKSEFENDKSFFDNNFIPAITARALYSLKNIPEIEEIINIIIKKLLDNKCIDWTWNYNVDSNSIYPNDMDDTFCVLHTLFLYNKEIINSEVFSCIVKILIKNEIKLGGPYYTWILNEHSNKWNDIDPWVNANIGGFLSLNKIKNKNLIEYFSNVIEYSRKNKLRSKFYLSNYSLYYFLSFWYVEPNKIKLIKKIQRQQNKDGSWGNFTDTVFAIVTLIRFGGSKFYIERGIKYLLKLNDITVDNLYIENIKDGKINYISSKIFSIAIYIEALTLYRESIKAKNISAKSIKQNEELMGINDKVIMHAKCSIDESIIFKKELIEIINTIESSDKKFEITTLFYQGHSSNINTDLAIKIGHAHLLGWIGYDIYDSYCDNSIKKPSLALAHYCIRKTIEIYKQIIPIEILEYILGRIDNAQYFEQKFLIKNTYAERIPNFAIYNKSIGHSLSVIGSIIFNNKNYNLIEINYCIKYFEHYLLMKQLCDDAHDWKEDINKDSETQITSDIKRYKKYFDNSINDSEIEINLNFQELKTEEYIFWNMISIRTAYRILFHNKRAIDYIDKLSKSFMSTEFLKNLLIPYEKVALDIIQEHKNMRNFVINYYG